MARKTVTEAKLNLIRKRHLQGVQMKDIADEVGLSVKTVSKYIKASPARVLKNPDAEDDVKQIDYTTVLTKREEKIAKKIMREIALYEDDVEGWSYHLTAHDERIRQQGLWWAGIVYPASAPPDWIPKLKATGMQIAISPLHDKDTWDHPSKEMVNAETGEIIPRGARYKMGDPKMEHWHVLFKSEKKISWREANELFQRITHGPYIQKCRSLRNAYDYFLHLNDPLKYQGYFKDEIQRLNGFVIEPNKFEQGILYDEIVTVVIEKKYTRWTDVCKHYHGQPEYMLMLSSRPAIITEVIKDNWRERYPEGRVHNMRIVE